MRIPRYSLFLALGLQWGGLYQAQEVLGQVVRPDFSHEDTLLYSAETFFRNARMVTRGGDNAEAYWNTASNQLVFQSNNPAWGLECDQIFVVDTSRVLPTQGQALGDRITQKPVMVSTGQGRTTCAYFVPGD
ncbi:MAG: hypothetical protein ACKOPP_06755, partial [Bacteroidota bacterium]